MTEMFRIDGREAKRPTFEKNDDGTFSPYWEDEYAGCDEVGFEKFPSMGGAVLFAEQNPTFR